MSEASSEGTAVDLAAALDRLEQSPKAFTFWGNYRDLCVYVSGFDDGSGQNILRGFQDWLALRNPQNRSLAYPSLVAREVLGEDWSPRQELTQEQDARLRDGLLRLLRLYLEVRP
jgi:hypothetical protein